MDNLFQEFPSVSLAEWKDKILKDLKGKDLSVLDFHDPIEAMDFRAYYHREDRDVESLTPGSFPATRGSKTDNNDWKNGVYIAVTDEKEANEKARKFLMMGADLLIFQAEQAVNWKSILDGIQLEYIRTQFALASPDQINDILEIAGNAKNQIAFCFDAHAYTVTPDLQKAMQESQIGTYVVNGYGVQRCGANTWQEIAFCLSTGHEMLLKLMEQGFSIDKAAAQIHFHVGVGSDYFKEIAKFRALRQLWSKVVHAYNPEHDCSYNCQLTAIVGHTNKSLRDPYTNLLRQTTEAMSAANGADAILVLPYDMYNEEGSSELAQRMALNISNILKEESYLHHVIDASGGSYTIEKLTEFTGKKAWEYFQSIEAKGGIEAAEVLELFKNEVKDTAELRMSAYQNGTKTLIGVNKFPDPQEKETKWAEIPGYLGMNAFNADSIQKTETV